MGKLDNDLKAVMEDAFAQGEKLLTDLVPVLFSDELSEDEKIEQLNATLTKSKPKTYDDYIHDIKRAFIADGWKREEL